MKLNSIYLKLYKYLKGDPGNITLFTCAVLLMSEIPLYFFTVLDVLKLKSLFKYRLHYVKELSDHLGVRAYPPLNVIIETAKDAEFNFFFAYFFPAALFIKIGDILGIHVYDTEEGEKKVTWTRLFKETALISIVADLMFYGLHRLMHTERFYKPFHKKHHEFKYSIALAHHYMEFKEAVVFALPQALPPIVLWALTGKKMHITSMWTAFVITQLAAILGHAGYQVPGLPSWFPLCQPAYHDFHHIDYTVNFGAIFPFTDKLFGTYVKAGVNKNLPAPPPGAKSWVKKF